MSVSEVVTLRSKSQKSFALIPILSIGNESVFAAIRAEYCQVQVSVSGSYFITAPQIRQKISIGKFADGNCLINSLQGCECKVRSTSL